MFGSMERDDEERVYAEYRERSRNLSRFDAIEPPQFAGLTGCIYPLHITDEVRSYLIPLCNLALDKYNTEEGTNFLFVDILKSTHQGVAGTNYFITFQAKYPYGPLVTFQAYVFVKLPCYGGQPVVQSCAIKPT
ncbi:uncharacterized protein LOC131655885 [Vicia villosa]|uniref:uncharacterized protein LOC131655885 n=1 Tax=Vicia villosa TaxID=3911 RepID=UPI00273B30A6|nr:uncharacterized protein LOC131655885 [Vicia villosa]